MALLGEVVGLLFSCGRQIQLLRGIWDLSSPARIEPASPVLKDGFLTTGPQKSLDEFSSTTSQLTHLFSQMSSSQAPLEAAPPPPDLCTLVTV